MRLYHGVDLVLESKAEAGTLPLRWSLCFLLLFTFSEPQLTLTCHLRTELAAVAEETQAVQFES